MTNPSDIDRELLPCAHCGNDGCAEPLSFEHLSPISFRYAVVCGSCFSQGPSVRMNGRSYEECKAEAISAWSTRAQPEWRDISGYSQGVDGNYYPVAVIDDDAICPVLSMWGKVSHVPLYGWLNLSSFDGDGYDLLNPQPELYIPVPLPKTPS